MPTVQSILQLIDSTTEQITRSKQNWTAFLRTAAQLYKYPYAEQVMIYAQRPDAKACAEYDLWNRRMGRYVRRGSKGIALIDSSGDRPRLKYVFDISDTGGREHSLRPLLWELRLEHEDAVSDALHNRFGISAREGFIEQIRSIATRFADDYWQDNRGDLLYNIDGSYASEYDEFNQEAAFAQTAALGITYVTLIRCGFDPEDFIDNVEYLNVFDFNMPNAVNALGLAVSSGAEQLSERAAKVHAGIVEPSVDNMLKITSDGRKLGLDQRVINPDLPDDPESKVNLCVDNIHRIWEEGQDDKLTQLVFCDISTPKSASAKADKGGDKTAGGTELHALTNLLEYAAENEQPFSIYDDIREKLVRMGIPREQIAFIHEANTEVRKKELFAKVRTGQVRVLIGSTFKMGAGMNVQDRLIALHDLDCPWRPGDLEQRSGRIIRQGNRNEQVHIYRYVTEATFDAYLWQTVENKQKFISQIMTSKSPVRSCEDIDETALSYAEIKALCAGDERIKEKMDLDVDVARLRLMKANHQSQQYRLEDSILRTFPEQIEWNKAHIAGLEADMAMLAAHPLPVEGFVGMEVKGDTLTDKDNAGAALLEAFKDAKGLEPVPIGNYRGFAMSLTVEDFGREFVLTLKGQMTHKVLLGKEARGNLIRMENALNAMPERLRGVQERLDNVCAQLEAARAELGKPFPQEDELQRKAARLAELNAVLNIDDKRPPERLPESIPEAEIAKAPKPSVLQRLNAVPNQEQHSQATHRKQEVVL